MHELHAATYAWLSSLSSAVSIFLQLFPQLLQSSDLKQTSKDIRSNYRCLADTPEASASASSYARLLQFNSTELATRESRVLHENPDISGLGVLIAFMATAYLTLLMVILYYLKGWFGRSQLNEFDVGILVWIQRKSRWNAAFAWKPTFCKAILLLSDQQLVTGIATLAAANSQLRCGLPAYDWQIIIYLAWFSSLTHLATLTALREYFRTHTQIRTSRVCLMCLVAFPLAVALLPTSQEDWGLSFKGLSRTAEYGKLYTAYYGSVPAICYFHTLTPGHFRTDPTAMITMSASLIILAWGYITKIVKLYPTLAVSTRKWLREKPGNVAKKLLDGLHRRSNTRRKSRWWRTMYVATLALFLVLRILWLIFALLWGSVRLTKARTGNAREGDVWGFGQWVAILMLALPVLSIIQQWY
ncbi:MAG: hypothetical protein Q9174_001496, partial [Haloplaca sp. 1 TL-2023]